MSQSFLTETDILSIVRNKTEIILEEEVKEAQVRIEERVRELLPEIVLFISDQFSFMQDQHKIIIEVRKKSVNPPNHK